MLPEWTKRVRHEQTRRRRWQRQAAARGMRRRPEWSDEEMMMTREIFLLNMTPWHFRRKMENFQRTTITIGWTGVACRRRRPSRRICVVCSGARGAGGVCWQPMEPKINFINRGSPHLIHQNEVTQIRVRKRVTVNHAPPLCIPMLAQLVVAARRADHAATAVAACAAQDDIHEKKDKNTPLNEFPSGWLLKRLCLPISYDWKRLFLFT